MAGDAELAALKHAFTPAHGVDMDKLPEEADLTAPAVAPSPRAPARIHQHLDMGQGVAGGRNVVVTTY